MASNVTNPDAQRNVLIPGHTCKCTKLLELRNDNRKLKMRLDRLSHNRKGSKAMPYKEIFPFYFPIFNSSCSSFSIK